MNRILIIGAGSAIAQAVARCWAAEGAKLFLVARNAVQLDEIAADLRVRGAAWVATSLLDVNELDRHEAMIDAAVQALGALDIVLIAHGTLADQAASERDVGVTVQLFQTNALGVIALMARLANRLEPQGHGTLAVISSVAGDRGRRSNYSYGAAKAAVQTYAEGLRARLFRAGVQVTDIRPGFVAAPMTDGLRMPGPLVSTPEAVARRIVAGIERRRDVIYVPAFWGLIMLIIRLLPRAVLKRMKF